MTDTLRLIQATPETIDQVVTLLQANGLPHADVRSKPDRFYFGADGTTVVAIGGLEPVGSDGLLRSVVVKDDHRGQGYGKALCNALEDHATENGIQSLYLLTTTASTFFHEIGYREIARDAAPEAIRRTTEFTDYCPDTATCMRKAGVGTR